MNDLYTAIPNWSKDFEPTLQDLDSHLHLAILLIAKEVAQAFYPEAWQYARRELSGIHVSPKIFGHDVWFRIAKGLLMGEPLDFESLVEKFAFKRSYMPTESVTHLSLVEELEERKALIKELIETDGDAWVHAQFEHFIWYAFRTPTRFASTGISANVRDLAWCQEAWENTLEQSFNKLEDEYLCYDSIPGLQFPNRFSFSMGAIRTLDELKIIHFSAAIRQKPDWMKKLRDSGIVAKWRKEAYSQDIRQDMFDFLISELEWYASQYDEVTGIGYSTVPGTFFSDSLIATTEKDSLKSAVSLLEYDMPFLDWHPGSNDQVLDLVHPSLYPYVRGRTPRFSPIKKKLPMGNVHAIIDLLNGDRDPLHSSSPLESLQYCGSGIKSSLLPDSDPYELKWGHKSEYQWLPVDVSISQQQPYQARFLSYINNLHPDSALPSGILYPILERLICSFVPLFERTLTDTVRERLGTGPYLGSRPEFIPAGTNDEYAYYEPPPPPDEVPDDRLEWEYYYNHRQFKTPIIKPFVPPPEPGRHKIILGGRTVQIIVKLANVYLTPDKPIYNGGVWHVEGTDNEHIVATGIYYFDSENICDPTLSFRQCVMEPEYEQFKYEHFRHLYGVTNEGPTNQFLGTLTISEGRCICFPNGMQHKLSDFHLLDPTKPGHRKMVVFFLVDPSQRILSTSDVPPQRLDWFLFEVRRRMGGTRLASLPEEILSEIFSFLEGNSDKASPYMTLSEAKQHRMDLMTQRSQFTETVSRDLYEQWFNLCEH